MLLREFFTAWISDWAGRMSGAASLILTFWAAFYPPTIQQSRLALTAAALISFMWGSYHIWTKERKGLEAEKAKHERYKLIFEVDQNESTASFTDVLILTIFLRFENVDINPWTMKRLD